MRRSHILLACGVALAGVAASIGHQDVPSAEVRGAPLAAASLTSATAAAAAIAPAVPAAIGSGARGAGPSGGAAPAVARAVGPGATLAELVDLDRIALAPGGAHYEAPLKDGRRAVLTLDPALQAQAEKLLIEARAPRGAIVAMAPDGRILALAGRRGEPPTPPRKSWRDGAFDWRLAIDVWAPAASVFKLVTASALVAAGVGPDDKVCFHGGVRSVSESNLRDDRRDARCEDLIYGVAHSNNAILGKLAFQKLEPAALTRAAHALGVAQGLPGSELRGVTGAIAIPDARDLAYARIAAGFAGSELSAMGGALLAATFADDGEQPAPRLVASIDGVAPAVLAPRRAIPVDVARAVRRMMAATCEFGSAAKSFRRRPIHVAGKTGTLTRTDPFYMEHSWFVGYAPADRPQIVVSVILGNPESWHLRGHEAARRLIDRALGAADSSARPSRPARPARPAAKREKDRTAKRSSTRRS